MRSMVLEPGNRLGLLLLVATIAATAGWAVFTSSRKRRRQRAVASFAEKYSFEFSARDPFNLLWDYNFSLFEMGDGRGTENVVWGEWKGMPFRETDYWYYTTATKEEDTNPVRYRHYSSVVVDVPAYLPQISVEHENLASKLTDHAGFPDIQFESEEFNRAFRVTSDDRAFAFKLIDPRMMHWLLSIDQRFGFQTRGGAILMFARRLRPTDLIPLIGTAKELYDHIPRLVWTDYGTGSEPSEASN
jgi:Protein of unknown function (DUF3137)